MTFLMVVALLLLPGVGGDGEPTREQNSSAPPALESLRALYIAAVEDESAIDRALLELESLRRNEVDPMGEIASSTLTAYHGALISLRAKHGSWPPSRLLHLREGLELLDAAVRDDPENAEARYLRLMTCYYLPGILGRGGSVRQDFAALGQLLPDVADDYPPTVFRGIARFVLAEGDLPADARRALSATLPPGDG